MPVKFHATTICAVKHRGHIAFAGDGQVTMGKSVIMKGTARKIRKIAHGKVIAGFAGSVADAFNLEDRFEDQLKNADGSLQQAAVKLGQEWRKDPTLQKLEALLIVADKKNLLMVSGAGEVIEPDDNILAIGSGGNYALAAATAMIHHAPQLSAEQIAKSAIYIAGNIDVYTNHHIMTEVL